MLDHFSDFSTTLKNIRNDMYSYTERMTGYVETGEVTSFDEAGDELGFAKNRCIGYFGLADGSTVPDMHLDDKEYDFSVLDNSAKLVFAPSFCNGTCMCM